MSYKITDNTIKIGGDIKQKASIFLRFMTDEIVSISTPNTPKKTNRMRLDIIKSVLGLNAKVKWGKNYAKYQEVKQFKNYTTPGTGPHFAENAVMQAIKNTGKIASRAGLK